jgi:hypothetical protein
MNIESILQDLRRELPLFIERSQKKLEEDTASTTSYTKKVIALGNRLRADMDGIFKVMREHGLDCAVEDSGRGLPAMKLEPARLDFIYDGKEILCQYSGAEGRELRNFTFDISSVDYDKDVLPVLRDFVPYALGSEDFKWS